MTSTAQLAQIRTRLGPLRAGLLQHPIYCRIDSLESLHLFMQHHVFAVWDFMSLLKALQRRLCCVDIPWIPPADRFACRFINQIVLGEESDGDSAGGFASHFDLYHGAMRRCGASTQQIDRFLQELRAGKPVRVALRASEAPTAARRFVEQTFDIIDGGDLCAIAAAFAFGREDLLPDIFQRIVEELNVQSAGELEQFKFYLCRHIELDGDEHGPMAAKLIERLCGTDQAKWRAAENAALQSLEARMALWDGVCELLDRRSGQAAISDSLGRER